jgi:exopolysaccharide biosynthesis polyprenyl glycosylphosphotransferase
MDLTRPAAMTEFRSNLAGCEAQVAAVGADMAPATPRSHQKPAASRVHPIPHAGLIAFCDTAAALAALLVVLVATNLERMPQGIDTFLATRITLKNVFFIVAQVSAWPTVFRVCGLYTTRAVQRLGQELIRVSLACAVGSILVLPLAFTSVSGAFGLVNLGHFWLGAVIAVSCVRLVRRGSVRRQRLRTQHRVIIVGSGSRARELYSALSNDEDAIHEVVGFVENKGEWIGAAPAVHRLGTLDELEQILMHQAIDELFVTLPVKSHYRDIQEVIKICERVGVRVTYHADIFSTLLARPRYTASNGSPAVTMHSSPYPDDQRLLLKRAIDLFGALSGLIVLMPIMLLTAAAVKLTSPGPVIFAQERYGLNKRSFKMYKFRTMIVNADKVQASLESRNEAQGPVFKIKDDPRLTAIGKFLRRTSIDELPQLLNVIRGEMSLVGPRPLPLRDVRKFTRASDMRRFSVRPGLTCLWQISGRSNVGFTEWVKLDLAYIDDWSVALDLWILIRTIPAVLHGTGAS